MTDSIANTGLKKLVTKYHESLVESALPVSVYCWMRMET